MQKHQQRRFPFSRIAQRRQHDGYQCKGEKSGARLPRRVPLRVQVGAECISNHQRAPLTTNSTGLHLSESRIEIHIHISSVPSEVELKDFLHNAVQGSIASLTGQRRSQPLQAISALNAHHESIQAATSSNKLPEESFFAVNPALHLLVAVLFIVSALAVLDPVSSPTRLQPAP